MKKAYLNILLVVYFQSLCLASSFSNHIFFYRSTTANETGSICLSCPPGTYVEEVCTFPKTSGRCQICPVGYFQPFYTSSTSCSPCVTECLDTHMEENSNPFPAVCNSTRNFCLCKKQSCILNSKCPPGTEPAIPATNSQHTTCRSCPEETYSNVFSRTEMCKPMTKCKQDEVVIIDGNKTRDNVCILRYQDTVYLSNFKTTSQPSRVIVTRFNHMEILNAVFISTSVLIAGSAVLLLTVCIFKCRRLKQTESPAFSEERQECLSPCDSGYLEEGRICSDSGILHNDTKNKECSVHIERNRDRTFPGVCLGRSPENISDDNNSHLSVFSLGSSPECLLLNEAKAIPITRPSPLSLENETSFTLAKYNESEDTVLNTDNDKLFGETKTLQSSHLPAQKTILSTDWQWSEHITNQGCSLQLPNSDIITTFPPGVLSDCGSYAYCHKAVHNDILRLAAELCLPFDTVITSPSPEYHMKTTLAKFVQVNIPHRMRKNYKNIEVLSFSKQAGSKVKLVEVPKYYDRSEADDKLDMFCVINSESVDIHTKHFSGFVCTLCKKYFEYNLSASIYGRKGLIDNRIETLDILLYLKGAKSSIADFEAIVEDKVDERFHHLETTRVKLLTQHEQRKGGQLQFNFGLVSESVQTWTHRKAENGDQFVDTLVLANPEDLMLECEKHIICCPGTKWYLQRQGRIKSNCDFYVKIIHKEKPPTALSTLHHINTYIPACEDFCISGALSFASESAGVVSVGAASSQASQLPVPPFGTHTSNVNTEDVYRQNTATIPGAITDVVLTLNRHLSQQDSLQLVKHMGCLGHIPPTEDRSRREDIRYDYWYTAFIECYYHLKDQFVNRVLEGLRKMGHGRLVQLVDIHAPRNRIACIPPHSHHTAQEDDRHTQITQPSSADSNQSTESTEDTNEKQIILTAFV